MSGHLCLKWNNHSSAFLKNIRTVQTKEKYCDATIACEGKYFPVHRIVLSTCSDYFEEMFERMQCQHPYIVFKDIEPQEMELLLNYMYQGEVNVIQERLPSLIKAAEALKIKGLAVPDDVPSTKDSSNKRKNNNTGSPPPKRRSEEKRRKNVPDAQKDPFTGDTTKVFISDENDEPRIIKEEPYHPVDYGEDYGALPADGGAPQLPEENQALDPSEKDFGGFSNITEPPTFIKSEVPSKDETFEEPSSSWSDFPEGAGVQVPNPPSAEGINQEDMSLTNPGRKDGTESIFDYPVMFKNDLPRRDDESQKNSELSVKPSSTGRKRHQCPYCVYSSCISTNLKNHIKFRHTGEKPFPCAICPKRFAIKMNLERHLRTHSKDNTFFCLICQGYFRESSHMKLHAVPPPLESEYSGK